MKYRKKPVVIEAFQWGPEPWLNVPSWWQRAMHDGVVVTTKAQAIIRTREGDMAALPGDWIILGVKGELYPCKDEIFRLTYEEAVDADSPSE